MVHLFHAVDFLFILLVVIMLLNLFTFFAVRERFACDERLNKHQRSQRLVAGDLMTCSSHGYEAEVALVLHNVSAHLSSTLCSEDLTDH